MMTAMGGLRVLAIPIAVACLAPSANADRELLLATTTSLRDSGLLSEILPPFEARSGIRVRAVAVGSGAALRMGADGNVDALLTHAPDGEQELVDSGAVVARRPLMENHFVLAGPPADPAGVAAAATIDEALRAIAALPAPFVSRGDDSGTHRREVALLRSAGLDPKGGWTGFVRTGAGMGNTLQVAGERRAYVLSDLGTFLAFRERTDLVALSRPEPRLRNIYSVMRVNPDRFGVHAEEALALETYLLAEDTQLRIGAFGRERFGRPLFYPLHPKAARAESSP